MMSNSFDTIIQAAETARSQFSILSTEADNAEVLKEMADGKEIDYGGQAFPTEGGTDSGLYPDPGMSLRDWFAGQALSGYLAHQEGWDTKSEIVARDCYALADAMIAHRKAGA